MQGQPKVLFPAVSGGLPTTGWVVQETELNADLKWLNLFSIPLSTEKAQQFEKFMPCWGHHCDVASGWVRFWSCSSADVTVTSRYSNSGIWHGELYLSMRNPKPHVGMVLVMQFLAQL